MSRGLPPIETLDPRITAVLPFNDNGVKISSDAVTEDDLDRLAVELGKHLAEKLHHDQSTG
jgi:hypothetical protein